MVLVKVMQQRFSPGVIDYDGSMATHYPRGRALSSHSAETWRETIRPGRVFSDLPRIEATVATSKAQGLALEQAAARESEPVPVFETLELLVFRVGTIECATTSR